MPEQELSNGPVPCTVNTQGPQYNGRVQIKGLTHRHQRCSWNRRMCKAMGLWRVESNWYLELFLARFYFHSKLISVIHFHVCEIAWLGLAWTTDSNDSSTPYGEFFHKQQGTKTRSLKSNVLGHITRHKLPSNRSESWPQIVGPGSASSELAPHTGSWPCFPIMQSPSLWELPLYTSCRYLSGPSLCPSILFTSPKVHSNQLRWFPQLRLNDDVQRKKKNWWIKTTQGPLLAPWLGSILRKSPQALASCPPKDFISPRSPVPW